MTTPTRQELIDEIERTKHEIQYLKRLIEGCSDATEKRQLQRRLKELQYLQLWRYDLLQNEGANGIAKAFEQIPEVIAAIKNHERLPEEWRYMFASTALDEEPYCVMAGSDFGPRITIDLPLKKDTAGCYIIHYRE